MKSILAFETSSPLLSVALGTRRGKIFVGRSPRPLQHSEHLIPLIDRLLKKGEAADRSPLQLEQIDAVAIDRGPGSFTGLRIGFSLLKGFLAVQKKPCYGALSLDMIAANVRLSEGERLGVLVDARRDAIYSRFYRCRRGDWAAEGRPELLSFSDLKTRIRQGTTLVGDALIRYRGMLKETLGNRIHLLNKHSAFPSAATLVSWFQSSDPRLCLLKSAREWVPLYFRAVEAEENRRKLKSRAR